MTIIEWLLLANFLATFGRLVMDVRRYNFEQGREAEMAARVLDQVKDLRRWSR